MKIFILVLTAFLSLNSQATEKEDAQTAIQILQNWDGVSVACVDQNTAYGVSWDYDSRSVVIAVSTQAENFGDPNQTILLDTFPGQISLKIPLSIAEIASDSIVEEDAKGNPLVRTHGSMGKVKNMVCAYRADDVLFSYILQNRSSGTLVLE